MESVDIQEAELVTRSVARWGSAAAAIIFGVAFATDKTLSWDIASGQAVQIGMIVAIFAGYTLAWTKKYEALGSLIALAAIIGIYARGAHRSHRTKSNLPGGWSSCIVPFAGDYAAPLPTSPG